MARTASLGIRVEPELKERLEQAAKDDRRTVAAMVEKIVADWLETNGYAASANRGGSSG